MENLYGFRNMELAVGIDEGRFRLVHLIDDLWHL